MSESLTIRVGGKLAKALRAEAQNSGRTEGEVAREALEAHLERARKLPVMQRYFGVVEAPSDISTNKSYRRQWSKKSKRAS